MCYRGGRWEWIGVASREWRSIDGCFRRYFRRADAREEHPRCIRLVRHGCRDSEDELATRLLGVSDGAERWQALWWAARRKLEGPE